MCLAVKVQCRILMYLKLSGFQWLAVMHGSGPFTLRVICRLMPDLPLVFNVAAFECGTYQSRGVTNLHDTRMHCAVHLRGNEYLLLSPRGPRLVLAHHHHHFTLDFADRTVSESFELSVTVSSPRFPRFTPFFDPSVPFLPAT